MLSSYVPLFREMLQYMREQGHLHSVVRFHTESGGVNYQNAFNSSNAGWIWNETNGRVADSIFLNYWYGSTALKDTSLGPEELNLEPYPKWSTWALRVASGSLARP